MYWTVVSPQTIACRSNWTSVPAHDVSHLTITSWIICPLKHMFYSSRTYGLPWSALRTIWSSQASFLDVFCLIRVIIVLVFCQNGVKNYFFFLHSEYAASLTIIFESEVSQPLLNFQPYAAEWVWILSVLRRVFMHLCPQIVPLKLLGLLTWCE